MFRALEGFCRLQATQQEIEDILQTDHKTIDRLCQDHYGYSFSQLNKRCSSEGKISLRRSQAKLAEKSPAMGIWLGKQWLGQRDNDEVKTEAHPMLAELSDILKNDK